MRVKYDVRKSVGERVMELSALCLNCEIPHYEPVTDDAKYSILVPSFIAGGGDGYSMFAEEALAAENLGKLLVY